MASEDRSEKRERETENEREWKNARRKETVECVWSDVVFIGVAKFSKVLVHYRTEAVAPVLYNLKIKKRIKEKNQIRYPQLHI